ncbi:hypothetical protein RhiJN_06940 [Ceratobasidium sp. AG-Ba]|nr:hypothetical protein RhiJN_06940 [Ceratobasidium sp. AG-Ba]
MRVWDPGRSRRWNRAPLWALPDPAGPPGGGGARSGWGLDWSPVLRTTTGSAQPRWAFPVVAMRVWDPGRSRRWNRAPLWALPDPAGPPGGGGARSGWGLDWSPVLHTMTGSAQPRWAFPAVAMRVWDPGRSRRWNRAPRWALPDPAGPPGGGGARSGWGLDWSPVLRTTTGSAQPRRASRRWTCVFGMPIAHNYGFCPTSTGLPAVVMCNWDVDRNSTRNGTR